MVHHVIEGGYTLSGVRGHYELGIHAPFQNSWASALGNRYAELRFGIRLFTDEGMKNYASSHPSPSELEKGLLQHGFSVSEFHELRNAKIPFKGVIDVYLAPRQGEEGELTLTHVGAVPVYTEHKRELRGKVKQLAEKSGTLGNLMEGYLEKTCGQPVI